MRVKSIKNYFIHILLLKMWFYYIWTFGIVFWQLIWNQYILRNIFESSIIKCELSLLCIENVKK